MLTENFNAVIMAGGRGSRLMPLTESRPKPLLPVGERPMLSHVLSMLERLGKRRVALTLGYLADSIREYYGDRFGLLSLCYCSEKEPLGSAGGVKKAYDALFGGEGDLLVLSGDCIFEGDLAEFAEAAGRARAYASILCRHEQDCSRFGRVECDEKGNISRFVEKDGSYGGAGLINCGIYYLGRQALEDIPNGVFYDFGRDLFPAALARSKHLYAHIDESFFCDVGTRESYLACNLRANGGQSIFGRGASASASALVSGSIVMEGARVGAHALVENSVVGKNCVVGEGSIVRAGSVIPDGTVLPPGSIVSSDIRIV